ncbi:MAG: hypothetical protein WBC44_18180 [Planctomycetaceae bacterium]
MTRTTRPHSSRRPVHAGVFDDVESADRAVAGLLEAGFSPKQISVVCSDAAKRRHFTGLREDEPSGSHTAQAAAAGGTIGLALGSLVALAGVAATGGAGIVAAGAIVGTGVTGSFIGAMLTRGVEKEAADFYDQELRRGQILVVVEDKTDHPHFDDADRVLREAGAVPFSLRDG